MNIILYVYVYVYVYVYIYVYMKFIFSNLYYKKINISSKLIF